MTYYQPEPAYTHGSQPKVGILLANLGTPDAPTAKALRPYLKQFLMDRRVVEIPRLIWCWILYCIILVIRPKKSAEKYASIWRKDGSPLMVYAQQQKTLFQTQLSSKINSPFAAELGMTYGNPSMQSAIESLKAQGCDRILVFPLYPQYAASSTAAALDAVWRVLLKMRNVPAIRTIKHYHDHPLYIQALASHIKTYWQQHGQPEKLVMSFHGVPKFHLLKGDPYHCECHKTARLLAEVLGLNKDQYQVAFQSRFGRQEWLQPYLANMLDVLGKQQLKRIDVICPGFSSDCLETLEEIAMEGKHLFQSVGGGDYHYIPALNSEAVWIEAMRDIALEHLQGWVSDDFDQAGSEFEAQVSNQNALAMGAKI
ncbi:ferrochelatase [Methylophilus sp. 5]|uniref:ferrochelatase n=1 Tax=Methylophilus sp. 5 TaxID=1112274 RepID=UPI00048BB580|nr:ferrochelatase [Methylophilus sp. 5]